MDEAVENLIVGVDEALTHLKIQNTKVEQDRVLLWLQEISAAIEEEIQDNVVERSYEEILDGSGSSELMLRHGPVSRLVRTTEADPTSILGSLRYRSSGTGAWANLVDDSDSIYIDGYGRTIELLDGLWFPSGQKNIRVNYVAGWKPADVPGTIRLVCFEMLQIKYRMYVHGELGKSSENQAGIGTGMGGATVTYAHAELTAEHKKALAKFKRLV